MAGFFRSQFASIHEQFDPKGRFIRFFLDNPHFGNEIGGGSCPAGCPVIRAHGSARSQKLTSEHMTRAIIRQSFNQLDDFKRIFLRSLFQIFVAHIFPFS